MADRRDYYAVLGVAPVSEDVVIAAAYRALMRRYHPDTNKDATAQQKAREINEADGVLGDAAKRAEYDRQRATSQAGRAQQQRNSGQGSSKAPGPKPSASAGAGAAPRQQPPPPTGPSSKNGSGRWLMAASLIGILALPALLSDSGNEAAENTMNVDETLTTENIVASDEAVDAALDAAGNAVDNAADALNSTEAEAPLGLSKLPDAQVEYSNVESAAQKFAAILIKDGIAGARSFSDRCHNGVVAKPNWAAADYCAAFDFAAAHIDEAISKRGQFPENGYFQFQSDNQDDAYVAAGAYAFSLSSRLATIRRAVEPAVVEAVDVQLARQRAREQTKPVPPSASSVDDNATEQARAD